MTRAEKLEQKKLNALVLFLDSSEGPRSSFALAQAYGVDEPRVAEILKRRGRYQHG